MVATARKTSPVQTREELLYLLTRASELEHNLACSYLYAGYSLKTDLAEGGLTEEELVAVRTWKRSLATVAVEEMLHLGQVSNIITAVGGAPHFARSNFPLAATTFPFGIPIDLQPFSQSLIDRLVCYEMPEEGVLPADRHAEYDAIRQRVVGRVESDSVVRMQNAIEPFDIDFRTVGEFYHKIESAFHEIPPDRLFIGNPSVQATPQYLDFPKQLVQVTDVQSACAAIEMIIQQGESPTTEHPEAHFVVFDTIRHEYEALCERAKAEGRNFDPVRPLLTNPSTRGIAEMPGTNRITNPVAAELASLFNSSYAVMLMMLARFFAHVDETEDEMRLLARGTLRIMASGLRPLGEALAKLPAGREYPGMHAGPGFGFTRNIHLLAHKRAAWILFLERLYDISMRLTRLSDEEALPPEVAEAAAALESVAEHLTPFIPEQFAAAMRDEAEERNARTSIRPEIDGPYIVRNLRKLTNSKGDTLGVRPIVALCRCGGSSLKPYCDGTHARIGFSSAKEPARTPDHLDTYTAPGITVFDNRGTCCHFGNCTDHLPTVFHHEGDPFVTADGDTPAKIIDIVRQCPSGALGYAVNGDTYHGEEREPEIYVAENASYYVRGNIELEGEPMNHGANREHYALCRCGHSKNKPFCDGTHWWIQFRDENN
ncbi:MAG: CDGSH iron-sulfur domain-containing protein [Candidatus Eremiobacteraeota bacterium]|nr:CDGSH iron-sulfur domain-containing protein [Candidatus Eremiobacteraeota bacterium]